MSVFAVGEDGSLDYLSGKDVELNFTVSDLEFFPPRQPIPRPALLKMY